MFIFPALNFKRWNPPGWEGWVWSLPTIAKAGDAATPLGTRGCDFLPNRKFISQMGACRESSRT